MKEMCHIVYADIDIAIWTGILLALYKSHVDIMEVAVTIILVIVSSAGSL